MMDFLASLYDPSEIQLLVPILISTLAGSLIGLERELRHKVAGIGTNILICAAACVFTIISARVDPLSSTRISANILTGVGFIGAGLILRGENDGNVHGLTTAAGIWMAAAIGMAFGYGYYIIGALATIIAIWAPRVPHWAYRQKAKAVVASTGIEQAVASPTASEKAEQKADEKAKK